MAMNKHSLDATIDSPAVITVDKSQVKTVPVR